MFVLHLSNDWFRIETRKYGRCGHQSCVKKQAQSKQSKNCKVRTSNHASTYDEKAKTETWYCHQTCYVENWKTKGRHK